MYLPHYFLYKYLMVNLGCILREFHTGWLLWKPKNMLPPKKKQKNKTKQNKRQDKKRKKSDFWN